MGGGERGRGRKREKEGERGRKRRERKGEERGKEKRRKEEEELSGIQIVDGIPA